MSDAGTAAVPESGCLGMQPKAGGKLHLRLNTGTRPIVDKHHKGKLKRTLERVQEGVKPGRYTCQTVTQVS